jgi:uncharacterized protein (DUF488 family)
MSPHPLFTTGYAGHELDSFVAKLRQHEVNTVIDIRQNPASRKRGFSLSRLSAFLAANGIGYVHVRELGVPRELRQRLAAEECTLDEYFAEFRKYAVEQDGALSAVAELAARQRCCLLCVETRPEDCHRSIVAEVLAERTGGALNVIHI